MAADKEAISWEGGIGTPQMAADKEAISWEGGIGTLKMDRCDQGHRVKAEMARSCGTSG